MPYCADHDRVYTGTCPDCAGDDPEVSDPGVGTEPSDDGTGDDASGVDDLVADALSNVDSSGSGDVVSGDQTKSVESTTSVSVDDSTTVTDDSTTVTDASTTVSDSVVKDSAIGGDGDGATVEDSVVQNSRVGATDDGPRESAEPSGSDAGQSFCVYCGTDLGGAATCPECGREQ
ncbi:hypothetical protein U3A55_08315 [Salarchaeum sp. III]|uniref:hypothetical protein n=1 Tax=Salarchaeum sp. III TaxID=3107927 RepID=UPI002EDAC30A